MSDAALPLDISPLVNAVKRLREGLERHHREPLDEQLRDGLILLRSDWPAWRRYRDMRARTSHTYAAAVAAQVAAGIPDFLAEATYLVEQLRQRLR